ncbi:beta-1,3-galactosyltransferase 5-like [Diachasmimorpha longicaudata]|uniref:beta-1,3-galactosyltransferase 5-like n=1 Tax=Diachasmimorpha longicaudata TaxID=58733 RepID=UPI0030B91562
MDYFSRSSCRPTPAIFILCLTILNLVAFSRMTIRCMRNRQNSPSRRINIFNKIVHSNSVEPMELTSTPKFPDPKSSSATLIERPSSYKALKFNKDAIGATYPGGHSMTIQEKCPNGGEGIDLVIIITSSPSSVKTRTAIRQTWGSFGGRADVRVLFILGETKDTGLETLLQREEKLYGDIIRGKFYDSYLNLTLKTISTLEWFDRYCSGGKFLLKTDDDMFINVPRLISFIEKHKTDRNVIFGLKLTERKPIRDKNSKWYVSWEEYKPTVYPDYVIGAAYLLSNDIIHELYETALHQSLLNMEDVFITGVVAGQLGIERVHADEFWNQAIEYTTCNIQQYISIHAVSPVDQFNLWQKLFDDTSKC